MTNSATNNSSPAGAHPSPKPTVTVRTARREDIPRIFEIIDECAASGSVLPRSAENIALAIESFFIGEVDGRILGCCALVTCGPAMAEIRSVATSEAARGMGVARAVVEFAVIMARSLELERLFLLTKIPGFFEKLHFSRVEPESLPDSFIADVVHTQKRSLFNKTVMMRNLTLDAVEPAPAKKSTRSRKAATTRPVNATTPTVAAAS